MNKNVRASVGEKSSKCNDATPFIDLNHKGNMVTSITFDRFGGFLMTSAGNELTLFNYKSWKKPIGVLRIGTPVQSALFDMNCSKIYAGSQTVGTVKMLTL